LRRILRYRAKPKIITKETDWKSNRDWRCQFGTSNREKTEPGEKNYEKD